MDKRRVVNILGLLPNWVNICLLKMNRYPGLLFGERYREVFKNFFSQWPDSEFLGFFRSAVDSVPFYQNSSVTSEVSSLEEFRNVVPIVDKDTIMNVPDAFISRCARLDDVDAVTTGGTSGKPLKILLPKSRFSYEFGALHALWGRVGYRFDTRAVVRNEVLPENQDFTINPITKEVVFDGFRNDTEYLDFIFKTMRRLGIKFFHGYTSKAESFARHILSKGYDYGFIEAIITSSENFYDHQRKLFNQLEGVKHLNFYGHTEKLLLGGWCEEGGLYHFYNSYGFSELLDGEDRCVDSVGAIGELVGSTNYNNVMPLFRYRTGDYAVKGPEKCQACGFEGLSVSEILGRWNGERVFNSDGSFVTTTSLNLHSDLYAFIDGLQYFQKSSGNLEIRVVPGVGYNDSIESRILDDVARKLRPDSKIVVRRVSDVERLQNGKFLLLISHIDRS